jgi:hypothetical protein
MKVFKPGMMPPKRMSDRDIYEDIKCDMCQKSCMDSENMNFEYAQIEVHWGFGSNKDTEKHEAQICEKCYDKLLGLGLKPQITNYL